MFVRSLFTWFVLIGLTTPALAKERPKVRVFLNNQTSQVREFSKYDRNRFQFEFKTPDSSAKVRLSQLAGIGFDTLDLALPAAQLPAGSDEVSFRSGASQPLLFTRLEKDKARFGLEMSKTKQEIDLDSIRFIRFNHDIINIDRYDYGCDMNLLDEKSTEEMAAVGAKEVEDSAEIVSDTFVQHYLDSLTNHLAQLAKGTRKQYTTKLINTDDINAFTPGGGHIYLLRGLVERLNTESELAGVIAHEMGHNIGNHMAQQYSKQLVYAGVIGAAGAILNEDKNAWAKTLTQAGGILAYFSVMKYGRDEERQADLLGCYNLYSAHINPKGMVTLFETFSKLGGHAGNVLEKWSASHPDPDERKDNIAAELAELNVDSMPETSDYFNRVKQYIVALPLPQYLIAVFQDTATIGAGQFLYKPFQVPTEGMKNVRLIGRFASVGGLNNEIVFHVFDEANFLNLSKGGEATSLLSTERLTAGEVNIAIPGPGIYYLVFDNRHAWVADRRVAAMLQLQFTQR